MTLSFLDCGAFTPHISVSYGIEGLLIWHRRGGVSMHWAFDGLDYAAEKLFNQTK
jgi:hypothetical protein